MLVTTAVSPSQRGYLRTRRIMLHPVFIIMELFTAMWIVFKRDVFSEYKIDFAFFQVISDSCWFLLWILMWCLVDSQPMPKHTRKGIILLFASGFIGVFGSQYLFWLGLAKTPYGTELPSVWLVLIPILTITIGLITKKEAWRKTKIFGLVLSALGLISMLAVYITASDIDNAKIIESNIYFFLHSICKAMNVFIQRSLL